MKTMNTVSQSGPAEIQDRAIKLLLFHLEDEDLLRGIKELAKGKQNARRP
jgi:hypothetical protein